MELANTLAYFDMVTIYTEKGFKYRPTNIRLEWKWMELANSLAYYNTATITAVKCFMVQAFKF
jgi:hypothetical protein